MASSPPVHVAVAPFPFASHAAIIFSIARALAAKAPGGASFSFLATDASLRSLGKADDVPPNLRLVAIPDGVPEGSSVPVPQQMGMFMASAEAGGLKAGIAAAEAAAGGLKVTCVLADGFLWMAADVAEEIGATWVPIWTASSFALLGHLNTDALRATIGTGDQAMSRAEELLGAIPGLGNHRVRDLPDGVVTGDFNHVVNHLLHKMAKQLPRARAIALNTFPGLDPPEVDAALAAVFPARLPIGPFHMLLNNMDAAAPAPSDPKGCLAWLDGHGDGAVAYVSFGTVATPPPQELAELALGLEQSGAPFLWSLKEEMWKLLPEGFLERSKDRALVVGWAPQVEVLKHRAVGAFVTHAGWSSVLESITSAVPTACRPFFGDQKVNARSVSHVWEIGKVFEGGVITRDGVVRALDALLKEEEGNRMRARAKALQEKVEAAFAADGGCTSNFEELVKIVCGM